MSVEDFTALVDKMVESNAQDLWQLSRFLWENPELALHEFKAHNKLCEFLEKRGFKVHRNYVLDTAFRAEFQAPGGTDGPTVALMVEYDALPGIGHACGHNLIAEASIGAALAVMEAMKTTPAARGELIVLGTPAEESGGGKELLVQKGAFSDIDAALIAHPMNQDTLRLAFTALQHITVHYKGRPMHAAVSPWEGVNAMDAAVAAYVNVSLLRQQMKPENRIHGIITESGTYPNVIPGSTKVKFTVRAQTLDELNELVSRVEGCFTAAAVATGCTMTLEKHPMYKDVVDNITMLKAYKKHGQALVGANEIGCTVILKMCLNGVHGSNQRSLYAGVVFTDDDLSFIAPCGASTDAGNVSYEIPTIHPLFRIRTDGLNHTPAFAEASNSPEAQTPTLRVAKILALTALDLFTDPTLMSQARAEFHEWKQARRQLQGGKN